MLKPTEKFLIRCKQITITRKEMSQPIKSTSCRNQQKVHSKKNGCEVSQNSTLYIFCDKL